MRWPQRGSLFLVLLIVVNGAFFKWLTHTSYLTTVFKWDTTFEERKNINSKASGGPIARSAFSNSDSKKVQNELASRENKCTFRNYDSNRYYGYGQQDQISFLKATSYIFGQHRPLLLSGEQYSLTKLCIPSNISLKGENEHDLPFYGSGSNPSVLRLDRLNLNMTYYPDAVYIATIIYKGSTMCIWESSTPTKPPSRHNGPRTMLLLLNQQLESITATRITLRRGKRRKQQPALDDARLVLNNKNELWLSFQIHTLGDSLRRQQLLAPLHIVMANSTLKQAVVQWKEIIHVCCGGRNMGVLEPVLPSSSNMTLLVHPDPVTTLSFGIGNTMQVLLPTTATNSSSSPYHGTTGMLLYRPDTQEYLGLAHIHRPVHYDIPNPYAKFGHHYTHVWFTISKEHYDKEEYSLKRLSSEFVMAAPSRPQDAEVIQFASGLEVVHGNHDGQEDTILIGYGINDCEGAVLQLPWKAIDQDLLRSIPAGTQISDHLE